MGLSSEDARGRTLGVLYGTLAYGLWGVLGGYWRLLGHVATADVIAHRAVWSFLMFGVFAVAGGQLGTLRATCEQPRKIGVMAVSGAILAVNWTVFVWASMSGHLLYASLGYFISPLFAVALGLVVLKERLRPLQWVALALAFVAVAFLTYRSGAMSGTALVLAGTLAVYGLVRKTAQVGAVVGSTIETLLMAPIAAVYLIVLSVRGGGALGHSDVSTELLLIGSGVVTAVPLLLFTSATRLLPLSTVGFLQYLAPTGHFVMAVFVYREPLSGERMFAFALIWVALAVFSVDLWRAARAASARAPHRSRRSSGPRKSASSS